MIIYKISKTLCTSLRYSIPMFPICSAQGNNVHTKSLPKFPNTMVHPVETFIFNQSLKVILG